MKILVIGSGGREHALCWRLAQSPNVSQVYCAPGNPGTAQCAINVPIAADRLDELLAFAETEQINLTIVGPEAPLCAGVADRFRKRGQLIVGPNQHAAQLEGSKEFAKNFFSRHRIPTAQFETFSDVSSAAKYISANKQARVIKADGLAAGKGVVVADSESAAITAAQQLLSHYGGTIVIEEQLIGPEVSVIALVDGKRIVPLAPSQDHKAVFDGDKGPNTGGMGAYSPAHILTEAVMQQISNEILAPTIDGFIEEGFDYRGILFAGLMLTDAGPKVLEFNCRFGDPETQTLMVRWQNDPLPYFVGMAEGNLPTLPIEWDNRTSVCVVMAAPGYPDKPITGAPITGLDAGPRTHDASSSVQIFHAGTAMRDNTLVTAGGRVLGVTALDNTLQLARARAYEVVETIHWDGVHYRRDIGDRNGHAQ